MCDVVVPVMQRRVGGHSGASSPAENGRPTPLGGALCPGGSACVGNSSNGGLVCGCSRKSSSPLRRAFSKLRFRARQAVRGSQKSSLGAYLAAFVLLVWCGMQASALLRAEVGGEQREEPSVAVATAAAAAAATAVVGRGDGSTVTVAGYGEDDIGPRLAYGIMVYQRVGYSPQMTLDQFARMFNALYDKENT